jgi:hypothetical protein
MFCIEATIFGDNLEAPNFWRKAQNFEHTFQRETNEVKYMVNPGATMFSAKPGGACIQILFCIAGSGWKKA